MATAVRQPKPIDYPSGFTKALVTSGPSAFQPDTRISRGAESPYPDKRPLVHAIPNRQHAAGTKAPPLVMHKSTVKR